MSYIDYALCCKALGDETRAKIFDMLKCGTLCGCKILEEFHCTQPTLSYHMKMLTDSGLVNSEKNGKWCHYSINVDVLNDLSEFISKPLATKKA
ncbi:MAG: metalloregulator ArsR/SmtB family transcription factor [Clostridia bacterium]